jgi:hypothetical protein
MIEQPAGWEVYLLMCLVGVVGWEVMCLVGEPLLLSSLLICRGKTRLNTRAQVDTAKKTKTEKSNSWFQSQEFRQLSSPRPGSLIVPTWL